MKRNLILALSALSLTVLVCGWIFYTRTGPANPEYRGKIAGDAEVSVWFEHGTALDAAQKTADDYRRAGWEELPVSTKTFKMFAKGKRTAAVLAEDIPTGVRLTELKRHGD